MSKDRVVAGILILSSLLGCGGGKGGGSAPPQAEFSITTQPSSQSILTGQTATFTVVASGSGPLGYQWQKNGAAIPGARSASYTTPVASLADDGTRFSVIVTESFSGSRLTSPQATLIVTQATRTTQHYVDPVNGSEQGDGSAAHPWKSLQDVIEQKVETRNWEGPLPYSSGQKLAPVNAGAPVKAGDTVWLKSGDYGALVVRSAYNAAPVILAADTGSAPRFSRVLVQSSQNWILRGFTVSPAFADSYSAQTMVTVESHTWRGPASDVILDSFEIYSVPDESVWTQASDWDTKAADGVSASADRVTVSRCRIRHTDFGIAMTGKGSRVEYCTVDGFSGDGLRGLGDDEVFEYNVVKNRRDVNANHPDGFQSWSYGEGGVGTGVVKNLVLRGNRIIGHDNPALPFVGTLQGIGCFDGVYENWIIENNVILTDHWHGISLYGARNCRIVNNTVLDLNQVDPGPPWIRVTAHKNGTPSSGCLVRNNLATDLSVEGGGNTEDHNLILPSEASSYFVDLPHFDVHLSADSPAIGGGSSEWAPALDADERSRPQGGSIDLGAYERAP